MNEDWVVELELKRRNSVCMKQKIKSIYMYISGKIERKWKVWKIHHSFHVCIYEFFKKRTGTVGRRKILKEIIEEKFISWRKRMNFRRKSPSSTKQNEWKKIYIYIHLVKFQNSKDKTKISSYCLRTGIKNGKWNDWVLISLAEWLKTVEQSSLFGGKWIWT